MTALLWATDAGQTEAVKFLLKEGADLSAVDNEGNTALHLGLCKTLVFRMSLQQQSVNTVRFIRFYKIMVRTQTH